MKKNVIYFPYILVPYDEWFTRVLLYWDEIHSIIPSGLSDYLNKHKYMQRLIETELIQPVNPSNYIERIPNYREAFLNLIDSPNYPVPHGVSGIGIKKTTKVHIEKLGYIGTDLVERGLARKTDFSWYNVDVYTANLFMTYLASILGKLPDIDSEPITDSIQSLNSFSILDYNKGEMSQEIDEMRKITLKDILPAPRGGISPEKLAEFKEEHKKELPRFREKIEYFLHDAAEIKDPTDRSKEIKQFISDVRDDVDYLSELMKSTGWNKVTYGNLIGYSSLVFGVGSYIATPNLLGAVGAALGITGTIKDVQQERKINELFKSNYAAYAVMAQQKLPFLDNLDNWYFKKNKHFLQS
jgi:hypothetical protein